MVTCEIQKCFFTSVVYECNMLNTSKSVSFALLVIKAPIRNDQQTLKEMINPKGLDKVNY